MDALADFIGLTDVALRRRKEPLLGLFVAEGTPVVARALDAGYAPRTLAVGADKMQRADVARVVAQVRERGGTVVIDEAGHLSEVVGFDIHRGVLASFERRRLPTVRELAARSRTLVVLEAIVDHTNVGAALRSAVALGADGVVLDPRCADPLYRRAIRTSMGAVFAVPHTRCATWPGGLQELQDEGFRVLALTPTAAALDLARVRVEPDERVALLLGAEGRGLSRRALAVADTAVRIPMSHGVDSLNVAATAALALWALAQVRGGGGW